MCGHGVVKPRCLTSLVTLQRNAFLDKPGLKELPGVLGVLTPVSSALVKESSPQGCVFEQRVPTVFVACRDPMRPVSFRFCILKICSLARPRFPFHPTPQWSQEGCFWARAQTRTNGSGEKVRGSATLASTPLLWRSSTPNSSSASTTAPPTPHHGFAPPLLQSIPGVWRRWFAVQFRPPGPRSPAKRSCPGPRLTKS